MEKCSGLIAHFRVVYRTHVVSCLSFQPACVLTMCILGCHGYEGTLLVDCQNTSKGKGKQR